MPKYKIYAGLGGSFGGAQYHCTREFNTYEEAEEFARELAMDTLDSYGGMHGLPSIEGIQEEWDEEGIDYDEQDLEAQYQEEADSWLTYKAVLVEDGESEDDEDYEEDWED